MPVSPQSSSDGPSTHAAARILYFVITFALFGVAVVAGTGVTKTGNAYGSAKCSKPRARERTEFMALAGMFMSLRWV